MKQILLFTLLYIFIVVKFGLVFTSITKSCTYNEFFKNYFVENNLNNANKLKTDLYILYEVNPSEGFNLRRDVYIRMAVFLKKLKMHDRFKTAKLVLPPFTKLFHWRSRDVKQSFLLWRNFFDIHSLVAFTDVIDYDSFLKEMNLSYDDPLIIDQIFQLQHFKDMFKNGVFIDKFKIESCNKDNFHLQPIQNKWNCIIKKFSCLKFQGTTKLLQKVINFAYTNIKSRPALIMFLNTEIVLHEQWGNQVFWMARRSMRFNTNLVAIASQFRLENFNSTNEIDLVQKPLKWEDEKYYRGAKGGSYLCAHLRRNDFLYGRENLIPSLKSAANQIKLKLNQLGFEKVFISSDCTKEEYEEIKSYLNDVKVYRFIPESNELRNKLKDGGVAIIDQIICSHAGYFLGTFESTFTYRIQEEREILGFKKNLTFNTFCKNDDFSDCRRNAVWPIVF